jgi:hemoglobin-like flavoprotein
MTSIAISRIEASFDLLSPRIDEMTRVFYDRLFALRPETRALFNVDMSVQRQHMAAALAVIARNLRMLDAVMVPLRELGAGHAKVGVRPEHYPPVREAMLEALSHAVGDDWTPDLAHDWQRLLDLVCNAMLEGASQAVR